MPRAAYLAPGVYVEEVPSARQPIAGVGTNTVGFIGWVEDQITYPERNENYDPVLAKLAFDLAEITKKSGGKPAEEEKQRAKTEIMGLEKENESLDKQIGPLQKKIEEEQKKPEPERDPELPKHIKKLEGLREKRSGNEKTIQDLQAVMAGEEVSPESKVSEDSKLKPYILKTFDVKADPCDTRLCTSFSEYVRLFGPFSADAPDEKNNPKTPEKWEFSPMHPGHRALTHAVYGFFNNGGTRCFVARVRSKDDDSELRRTLEEFESIDEVAIIAAPGLEANENVWDKLTTYASNHENVFAILDCPEKVENEDGTLDVTKLSYANLDNLLPGTCKDAAYYFPFIEVMDEAKRLQDTDLARRIPAKYQGRTYVAPSGHVAGIYARTDEERGVHKAPANAAVRGALEVKYYVSKAKQELLNPQGVNCIRNMNGNITVWGARTIGGDRNGEWKYVSVRRLFLFLQESIDEGTQWVVFEPNDPGLWSKIRLNVSAFLTNVWRNGALFGLTPEQAFYVKCDEETNPPEVRDLGMVVTEIGVAIVRPAEFVIFRIMQSTGQEPS